MKPFHCSLKFSYLQKHQSPIKKGGRGKSVETFFSSDEIG